MTATRNDVTWPDAEKPPQRPPASAAGSTAADEPDVPTHVEAQRQLWMRLMSALNEFRNGIRGRDPRSEPERAASSLGMTQSRDAIFALRGLAPSPTVSERVFRRQVDAIAATVDGLRWSPS